MRKKKIFISAIAATAIISAAMIPACAAYKQQVREKVESYEQETNEDGIAIDMSQNPYFMKKQPR